MQKDKIRDKIQKKKLSLHSFQGFIEYKAAWNGIPVVYVKADYTSQRCSRCGHTEKANRNGRNFKCRKCSYELNADLNAAINIGKRYKNFAYGYMSGATGDMATPLTLQATAYQGSPCL